MFLASPEESEWIHIQTVSLKGNSETISSVGVFFFPSLHWLQTKLMQRAIKNQINKMAVKTCHLRSC